ANYYAGYLAFRNEDYETALKDLMEASQNEHYQPVVPCLILQTYYKQKRFEELLAYSYQIHNQGVALKNEEEIALLTAEAYFFTEQYPEAAQHYEEYIALQDFAATSEVLYRTAYALYKAGDKYKARQYFQELALQQDAIGQLASYYTGLLYLESNQKTLALTAFDKAHQGAFSEEIQEEATFQYAQVSYALGHFASTIEILQQFQKAYPTSQHTSAANALLSQAYLYTQDYDLAIDHIAQLAHPPQSSLQIYQKATFYKGSECFNQNAYQHAIESFQQSLKHPLNKQLATQAHYWIGESYSALQQPAQAIAPYKHVLQHTGPQETIHQQALYGLAYAYFQTQHYAQALPYFVQYAQLQPPQMPTAWRQDAIMRTADCYYAAKAYDQALQYYDQVLQHQPAHVHYQKGIIYSLRKDPKAAQAHLKVILDNYSHTVYYEKALFETAHIALVQNSYPEAIQGFTEFIQHKPHSPQVPDALLNRAIAQGNLAQYQAAAKDYERLLQDYPQHPNAQSALLELPKVCSLAGEPEKFNQYLATYQAANPNAAALEKVQFDASKHLFYAQQYAAAIQQLNTFLESYPQSSHAPEAHFLAAEAHYRQGQAAQAQAQYHVALQTPQVPFYNKIIWRLATLAYQQQDFAQALDYSQQLQQCARNKKERYHALEGIMKANHALKHFEAMQAAATQIIAQGNLAVNATTEAILYLGKAAKEQGELKAAQQYFAQVVQRTQNQQAAEAQYLIAQLHYDAKRYQESLEALFELNKQFTAYKQWTNQGFLLIAANYLALDEIFQAKATLQSIIDHAEDPTTVATAKEKLAAIGQQAESPVQITTPEEEVPAADDEFKTIE
ncbi:MAG: tetratricopeptide repeat protein, partial [Bacteroidota bacterium]